MGVLDYLYKGKYGATKGSTSQINLSEKWCQVEINEYYNPTNWQDGSGLATGAGAEWRWNTRYVQGWCTKADLDRISSAHRCNGWRKYRAYDESGRLCHTWRENKLKLKNVMDKKVGGNSKKQVIESIKSKILTNNKEVNKRINLQR